QTRYSCSPWCSPRKHERYARKHSRIRRGSRRSEPEEALVLTEAGRRWKVVACCTHPFLPIAVHLHACFGRLAAATCVAEWLSSYRQCPCPGFAAHCA